MKRLPLIHAIALAFAVCAPTAFAADAAAPTAAAADAPTIDAQAARAELAELRTQMQEISRKMAALSGQLGDTGPRAYAMRYLGEPDRGVIGVVVEKDKPGDKGNRIIAVTPGSPADRAGIRVGDVITGMLTYGGFTIRESNDDDGKDTTNTILRNIKAGQDLTVNVLRDGKTLKFPLKAERREPYVIAGAIGATAPDVRGDVERAQRDARRAMHDAQRIDVERIRADAQAARADAERVRVEIHRGMPWWGLNMAPLNAELGHYFGVDKGALVLASNAQALPGLRGGDVITRVAGQDVARPEDVLRTLRDQPPGKNVPLRVLRERKTVVLDVKAPEFNSIFEAPPPPLPPLPPAPPAAPDVPSAAPPAPPAPPLPESAQPAAPMPPPKPPRAPAPPPAPPASGSMP